MRGLKRRQNKSAEKQPATAPATVFPRLGLGQESQARLHLRQLPSSHGPLQSKCEFFCARPGAGSCSRLLQRAPQRGPRTPRPSTPPPGPGSSSVGKAKAAASESLSFYCSAVAPHRPKPEERGREELDDLWALDLFEAGEGLETGEERRNLRIYEAPKTNLNLEA